MCGELGGKEGGSCEAPHVGEEAVVRRAGQHLWCGVRHGAAYAGEELVLHRRLRRPTGLVLLASRHLARRVLRSDERVDMSEAEVDDADGRAISVEEQILQIEVAVHLSARTTGSPPRGRGEERECASLPISEHTRGPVSARSRTTPRECMWTRPLTTPRISSRARASERLPCFSTCAWPGGRIRGEVAWHVRRCRDLLVELSAKGGIHRDEVEAVVELVGEELGDVWVRADAAEGGHLPRDDLPEGEREWRGWGEKAVRREGARGAGPVRVPGLASAS